MNNLTQIWIHGYIPAISVDEGKNFVSANLSLYFVVMSLLTLGAHAQRGLRYFVCVSVCVCVCVSVTQHLTFHMIIHATNDTNLLSGG